MKWTVMQWQKSSATVKQFQVGCSRECSGTLGPAILTTQKKLFPHILFFYFLRHFTFFSSTPPQCHPHWFLLKLCLVHAQYWHVPHKKVCPLASASVGLWQGIHLQRGSSPLSLMEPYQSLFVCWLFNVPATGYCISGTDLLRQFYVLPHWDRSYRSNFLPHPVTVYWHWADQSQCWPYNTRRLTG